MRPQDALIVVAGMVVCYLLGWFQGWILGAHRKITKSEAARVMAAASWHPKTRLVRKIVHELEKQPNEGFFRTVNK
jgi:predicted RNA binding protein YcfA (HicA-like mRNA interferase family)